MHRLGRTIEELARARQQWLRLFDLVPAERAEVKGPLVEVAGFGSNPGNLRMHVFVPPVLKAHPALVVALHGCGQSPAQYEQRAGWCDLAAGHGFLVCYPQQQEANNSQSCFNWFSPRRRQRDGAEAVSIREMIGHLSKLHAVDPARIFITGFSAGGAMSAALLVAYPDVFAAGAVIAGLPVGVADTVPAAIEAMQMGDPRTGPQAAAAVRLEAPEVSQWPRLLVWHGLSDEVVAPSNAVALVRQWRHLQGLQAIPDDELWMVGGRRRCIWRNAKGRDVIEHQHCGRAWPYAGSLIHGGDCGVFRAEKAQSRGRLLEKWTRLTDMPIIFVRRSRDP